MGALVVERAGVGVVVRSGDSRVSQSRWVGKLPSSTDGRVRVFAAGAVLREFDLLDGRVSAEPMHDPDVVNLVVARGVDEEPEPPEAVAPDARSRLRSTLDELRLLLTEDVRVADEVSGG